jgi:Alpha/beta hydrolase of unknown function (DUF900)
MLELQSIVWIVPILIIIAVAFMSPIWMNRHEPKPDQNQHKCTKHRSDPHCDPRQIPRPNNDIKIIRLTNAGEFADRCELTNALYELNWDHARPKDSFGVETVAGAESLPKLVILYVHGWKHSADLEDSDLLNFTHLVCELRERHDGRKRVVGIYIGWNANASLSTILENLSFWVKKNNADRIAQSAVVTKIVSAIGALMRDTPSSSDQFIAIGHSFGARILFSAISQMLIHRTEIAHPGYPGGSYRLVSGAANACIFLNPAFEASRYSAIDDISRKEEHFLEGQPPLTITISTSNDFATKVAFPIVQWLGFCRTDRELKTLGNYRPFFTHSLLRRRKSDFASQGDQSISEEFATDDLRLLRLGRESGRRLMHQHNPFIVAETSREVIDGHNGIWAEGFRVWLGELIAAIEESNDRVSPNLDVR